VPATIEPGESGNLILTITNGGTEYARNVELTLKPHSFISFGETLYKLQTIAPGSSVQVTVPIRIEATAAKGVTTIFFSIKYNEGASTGEVTMDSSTSITITKRALIEIENVSYSKKLIQPGDIVKMSIELKNVGKSEIKDLVVALKNYTQPFVSATGDMEAYVAVLKQGEKATVAFDLIVNKEANTVAYSIPVSLSYYDEAGVLHTEKKYIGMKVSGKPEFVITLESQSVYAGDVGELTISVANRGTATANFLTVRFDSQFDVMPAEYYVGNLEPDDYDTIALSINAKDLSIGKHKLSLQLIYKDPYNEEFTDSKFVVFTVSARPPVRISTELQLALAALVLILVYWKRKFLVGIIKRKK